MNGDQQKANGGGMKPFTGKRDKSVNTGHFKVDYPNAKQEATVGLLTGVTSSALVNNGDTKKNMGLIFDTGASEHMTSDHNALLHFQETPEESFRQVDRSKLEVKGFRSLELPFHKLGGKNWMPNWVGLRKSRSWVITYFSNVGD